VKFLRIGYLVNANSMQDWVRRLSFLLYIY
jgi:hypothetical protein